MVKDSAETRQQMLTDAFNHLQSAIDLLDTADAPGHIAAHADLAARQLEELLAGASSLTPSAAAAAAWPSAATS